MLPTQPYRLNEPDIVVPSATATQLEAMGNDFYRETGRTMVVTSGVRDPQSQADAMYVKFENGDNGAAYLDQAAMRQIKNDYDRGQEAGLTRAEIVTNMRAAIDRQMARGVLISRHLSGRAVDVRNNDLHGTLPGVLNRTARRNGFHIVPEGHPRHLHLQVP